jgi:hypothetical protein
MYGRKGRSTPLQREQLEALEDMRDDCIALFVNSGLRQKDIHERGGPTPGTISKWLYKETFFPRYSTIDSFLRAMGYGLTVMPLGEVIDMRTRSPAYRLHLDPAVPVATAMPARKKKA